jgi:hypothetical protein
LDLGVFYWILLDKAKEKALDFSRALTLYRMFPDCLVAER